jgi:NADPH2:quinone reductase
MFRAQAVHIREPGEPDVLELGELDVRDPGPFEIAVDVAAAGLNRADLLQRRGVYPAPPGYAVDVPGLEYAGTVAALGLHVTAFKVGDRVMGITAGGAMATRVVVHEREAIPVPSTLSLDEAAAVPEVFLTAFDALFEQGQVRLGESVLIHSVGSGVGTAMLQLAHVAGARTIGTSRTSDKLVQCKKLGLDVGIVPEAGTFSDLVRKATNGEGVQVALDAVGAAYLGENLRSLATRGRLVLYGTMSGSLAELPLSILMGKRARIVGTMLRSRPLEEKAALAQRFAREVVPLFTSGRVRPVIDTILPMAEVRAAHARMERNETFGKIVLRWG